MMNTQEFSSTFLASVTDAQAVRALPLGHVVALGTGGGQVSILSGRVWLTSGGDPSDHVLGAGESFAVRDSGQTLVETWSRGGDPAVIAWRPRSFGQRLRDRFAALGRPRWGLSSAARRVGIGTLAAVAAFSSSPGFGSISDRGRLRPRRARGRTATAVLHNAERAAPTAREPWSMAATPDTERQALRAKLVAARQALPDRLERAVELQNVLRVWLVGRREKSIGAYWPIKGEFDPLPALYRWTEASGDGDMRRIGLPVADRETGMLRFRLWYPGCEMELDAYDIPKPKDTDEFMPQMLVVPCLGFGPGGVRLGYGGGFFDRTLSVAAAAAVHGRRQLHARLPAVPAGEREGSAARCAADRRRRDVRAGLSPFVAMLWRFDASCHDNRSRFALNPLAAISRRAVLGVLMTVTTAGRPAIALPALKADELVQFRVEIPVDLHSLAGAVRVARVAVATPATFDAAQPWRVLIVSATSDPGYQSSRALMTAYRCRRGRRWLGGVGR